MAASLKAGRTIETSGRACRALPMTSSTTKLPVVVVSTAARGGIPGGGVLGTIGATVYRGRHGTAANFARFWCGRRPRMTSVTLRTRRASLGLEAARNGRAGLRIEVAPVEAEVLQHRRCDVALCHVRKVVCFAEWRSLWPEDRDPDVLATGYAGIVLRPVRGRAPATVIGRDDERRAPAVFVHGLERLPQLGDQAVREVQVVEYEVVAARMRPVVRLAEPEPHHARPVLLQVLDPDPVAQHVVAALFPELLDLLAQAVVEVDLGRAERRWHGIARTAHEERAVLARGGVLEAVPGTYLRDLGRRQRQRVPRVLENGAVRIAHEVVALDVRLRLAGQDFGVARVGEPLVVADRDLAALRLVAEHDPGRRQRLPDEGHQRLAARLRRLAPPALRGDLGVVDAGLCFRRLREHRIHTAEEFLHAHAVEGYEDDVVAVVGHGGLCHRRGRRDECDEARRARGEATTPRALLPALQPHHWTPEMTRS